MLPYKPGDLLEFHSYFTEGSNEKQTVLLYVDIVSETGIVLFWCTIRKDWLVSHRKLSLYRLNGQLTIEQLLTHPHEEVRKIGLQRAATISVH